MSETPNPAALTAAEEAAVVAAITAAEVDNRGEVRVHLEGQMPEGCPDPLARAEQLFGALGMADTRDGTAVLLYVAEGDRKAAVYAGPGVHGAREAGFWQGVIDAVAEGFGRGARAEGLVSALGQVGALLREAAPGDDTAGNELDDAVTTS